MPPWIPHLYGGKHLEATLDPSLIWGEASGGHPGSLTYVGRSIWRPPWIPHLYGGKHLEAWIPHLYGGSIWRPPCIPHLYGGKHLDGHTIAPRRPKTAHDGIIKELKFIAKNCFFATRGPLEAVLAATWLNMATRWPQDGSRCLQMVPRWPKMAPDGPKTAPRWPQNNPKLPQNGPRRPMMAS